MAIKLDGSVDVKRIHEFLEKSLTENILGNYNVVVDNENDDNSYRVPLDELLSFAPVTTSFYDNIFKLLSNLDDDELTFNLGNLTTNRVLTVPDVTGFIAINGMPDAFKFAGQATGGHSIESFSATKTFNLDNGNSQEMTLTSNVTSLTLSNKVNGGSYLIYLIQDVTGSRTIPTPDSTFGNKTDNSADFVIDANAVNLINVNVRPDGTTYYTVETYTP